MAATLFESLMRPPRRVTATKKQLRRSIALSLVGMRAPFEEYEDDPEGFIRNVLGVRFLTAKQIRIIESVRDNRVTNVPAGYNVGKTFIAACIVLWWVFAVGGMAVTTAPTERQVKRLLWREIRKKYDDNAARLGGTRDQMQLFLTEDMQAFGFSASSYDEDSAAGFHHPKLLAVLDEANGIAQSLDNAATGWCGGADNRLLRIGNPSKDGTPFAKACAGQGAIEISCFDHPNTEWAYDAHGTMLPAVAAAIMTEGPDGKPEVRPRREWPKALATHVEDVVPGAVSVEWLESTRYSVDRGEGTVFWQGRVQGIFPSDASTTLVPRTWFRAARKRYDQNVAFYLADTNGLTWNHGLDIGDGGDDHCRASRRGDVLFEVEVKATKGDRRDNARAIGMVLATNDGSADRPPMPGTWNIDVIGVGAGVVSFLLTGDEDEDAPELLVAGVNVGSKKMSANDKRKYFNLRAKIFWGLRSRFEDGSIAIAPMPAMIEQRLMEELANIGWEHDAQGKVKVEPKELVKAKIGRSPDAADGTGLAFHRAPDLQTRSSKW